jgi:hypothetical protein
MIQSAFDDNHQRVCQIQGDCMEGQAHHNQQQLDQYLQEKQPNRAHLGKPEVISKGVGIRADLNSIRRKQSPHMYSVGRT